MNSYGKPAFCTCISIDEKSQCLWIGDNESGVMQISYVFKGDKAEYKTEYFINDRQGLNDEYIRSILYYEYSNVWIGTRYGGI